MLIFMETVIKTGWTLHSSMIHAEVVTFVAGSLEAGGLPGSLEIPEVLK
jgi:hypothetical protein